MHSDPRKNILFNNTGGQVIIAPNNSIKKLHEGNRMEETGRIGILNKNKIKLGNGEWAQHRHIISPFELT